MLYQHDSLKPIFEKMYGLHAASLLRRAAMFVCLLIAFTGLQAQSYIRTVDQVGKINTGKLSNVRKQQSREYARYLSQSSISASIYPYYPYTPINFKNLPPPPFRVYLGKLTSGNADDFVLIAVHCKKEPVKKGTGPASQDIATKYVDDVPAGTDQADQPTNWYSFRVNKTKGATDRVIYERTNKKRATQYVNTFKKFLIGKKIDSPRIYQLCFVVRSNKKGRTRLQIQPVLVKNSKSSSMSGGAQHRIKWIFQDDRIVVFLGEFDTVNGANNDACCQTPPEEGNSIPDN